jgi:hypothetical protein
MFLGNDSLRGMSEQNSEQNCFCGPVLILATSCSRFEPLALNVWAIHGFHAMFYSVIRTNTSS